MEQPRPPQSLKSVVEKKTFSKKINPQEQFEQQQQILLTQLKQFDVKAENHFENLMQIVEQTILVMELDIFIPALYLQPDNPLTKATLIIEKVIEERNLTGDELARILACLSTNNLKQYYDETWMYEEKNIIFKVILQKIIDKISKLLSSKHNEAESQKDEQKLELTTSKPAFSPFAIASLMKNASLWDLKPSELWVDQLLETMELAVQENKGITEQIAYDFIYGFLRLKPEYKTVGKPKQAEFFAKLATKALPLLLKDEPPLKMFTIKNLAISRIYHIKALLPQPDHFLHRQEFSQAINYLNKIHGSANLNTLSQYLPEYVIPHKNVVVALEKKYEELWQDQGRLGLFTQEPKKGQKKNKKTGKLDPVSKKFHISLEVYIRFIRLVQDKNNPKALQWIIVQYSKVISGFLKGNFHTYFADEIKEFLKILRRCIWDTNLPDVIHTIKILSKEAMLDIHAKSIDGTLALDLLWINVVLSTVIPDEHLAYTKEEQQKLFTKIQTLEINQVQARELYEIKAMQWTGGLTFSSNLFRQMKNHLKEFDKGSSPSAEEEMYFEKISLCIPKHLQKFLKRNYICPDTGHEIDIVFLGTKKNSNSY